MTNRPRAAGGKASCSWEQQSSSSDPISTTWASSTERHLRPRLRTATEWPRHARVRLVRRALCGCARGELLGALPSPPAPWNYPVLKLLLTLLAGLLGLSLAAGLLLFALHQQQLAAKKPRAPRTFTVTAVQSV